MQSKVGIFISNKSIYTDTLCDQKILALQHVTSARRNDSYLMAAANM